MGGCLNEFIRDIGGRADAHEGCCGSIRFCCGQLARSPGFDGCSGYASTERSAEGALTMPNICPAPIA